YIYHTTRDTSRKFPIFNYKFMGNVRVYYLLGELKDSLIFYESASSDDVITDACINEKDYNYVAGISYDSGKRKAFIIKISPSFEINKKVFLEKIPSSKIEIETQGCRLYVSFIDTLGVLWLMRYDDNVNFLNGGEYLKGNDKIHYLKNKNKNLYILSS